VKTVNAPPPIKNAVLAEITTRLGVALAERLSEQVAKTMEALESVSEGDAAAAMTLIPVVVSSMISNLAGTCVCMLSPKTPAAAYDELVRILLRQIGEGVADVRDAQVQACEHALAKLQPQPQPEEVQ
jgi:hypothetical protein